MAEATLSGVTTSPVSSRVPGATKTLGVTHVAWFALACGALALLKGLRRPNRWSATLAQIDYRDGLLKRGLLGEALRQLGVPQHRYAVFCIVAYVLFAAFLLTLGLFVSRHRLLADVRHRSMAWLFVGSFSLTYMGHLVGYFDVVLLTLVMGTLCIKTNAFKIPALLSIAVVGTLIHEMYLVTCLPVTLLSMLAPSLCDRPTNRVSVASVGWALVALLVCVGLTLVLALGAPTSSQSVARMTVDLATRVDFPLRKDAVEVLGRSAFDNLNLMRDTLGQGWFLDALATSALAFLPTTCVFLLGAWRLLRVHSAGARRVWLLMFLVCATFSPISMVLMGWDVHRWFALAGVNAFLVYGVAGAVARSRELERGGRIHRSAINSRGVHALLLLNLVTGCGYLDGYRTETFPFQETYAQARRIVRTGILVPPDR